MWLTGEIKERGKQNFKKTYLYAIVVSLVIQSMLSFSFNLDLREKTSFEAKNMINIVLPKFVNHLTAFLPVWHIGYVFRMDLQEMRVAKFIRHDSNRNCAGTLCVQSYR